MSLFKFILFEFKYITPTIGLLVISSKMNLSDIEAISLSFNNFSSFDSINFNNMTRSASIPEPSTNNLLLILLELNPH